MISEEYRALNAELHARNPSYGASSARWAPHVMTLCSELKTTDVLDYGCGKAMLYLHLPFSIKCYDPAVPKYEVRPEPADIVVCTDVMEHVEPEHVDSVLADLLALTKRVLFLNIATRPAIKTLADGRNAHLTVEDAGWWMGKIQTMGKVLSTNITDDDLTVALEPIAE